MSKNRPLVCIILIDSPSHTGAALISTRCMSDVEKFSSFATSVEIRDAIQFRAVMTT